MLSWKKALQSPPPLGPILPGLGLNGQLVESFFISLFKLSTLEHSGKASTAPTHWFVFLPILLLLTLQETIQVDFDWR